MPDCPVQTIIVHGPCLDLGEINILNELTERVRTVVNAFIAAASPPPPPSPPLILDSLLDNLAPYLSSPPVCMGAEICAVIGQYIDRLFATGYVYRKTYHKNGAEWDWPGNAENIASLKECEAFWTTPEEIYSCMRNPEPGGGPFNAGEFRAVFGPGQVSGTCITKKIWYELCSVMDCANGGTPGGSGSHCYPDCQCPECDLGACEACNMPMCVWIRYTDPSGAQWDAEFKQTVEAGGDDCVVTYQWDIGGFYFDPPDNNYELKLVRIDVVKGHVFIWMEVYAAGTGLTGFLVPTVVNASTDSPGDLCTEWEPLYVLLPGGELQLYYNGAAAGKIRVRWIGFGDCPDI
jgi:hypothetical protein